VHPDVRRMLPTQKAFVEGGRVLCFLTGREIDSSHMNPDETARKRSADLVAFLTPIVKAFLTDASMEVTSLAVQIHGGMGFIEETGAAQHLRDSRILPIYEGTNGIQAIDLVGRKLLRDGGATVSSFVTDMRSVDASLANAGEEFAVLRKALSRGLDELVQCSTYLLTAERKDPELTGAAAFDYMMLLGSVIGGWQLARGALAAHDALNAGAEDKPFLRAQVVMAQFYAEHVLPRCTAYAAAVQAGSASKMALAAEHF
jgi:hypothetical protein